MGRTAVGFLQHMHSATPRALTSIPLTDWPLDGQAAARPLIASLLIMCCVAFRTIAPLQVGFRHIISSRRHRLLARLVDNNGDNQCGVSGFWMALRFSRYGWLNSEISRPQTTASGSFGNFVFCLPVCFFFLLALFLPLILLLILFIYMHINTYVNYTLFFF